MEIILDRIIFYSMNFTHTLACNREAYHSVGGTRRASSADLCHTAEGVRRSQKV